ncbi:hypothetical protein AB1462_31970, partial [Pseudomonas sp. SB113]|uniref:hypothetical protein n=1 Tax=Pseudomonas sp. SB113 TaxID=3154123 RepID=UPI00345CD689
GGFDRFGLLAPLYRMIGQPLGEERRDGLFALTCLDRSRLVFPFIGTRAVTAAIGSSSRSKGSKEVFSRVCYGPGRFRRPV